MTGPEHYRAAEAILAECEQEFATGTGDAVTADRIATAHVHATLALAAATGVSGPSIDSRVWREVAGEPRTEADW